MKRILILFLVFSISYLHITNVEAAQKVSKPQPKAKIVSKSPTLKARAAKGNLHKASRGETTADAVIRRANTVLGTPYSFGSTGNGSFDCSGFTAFAYKAAGIDLPHSSQEQASLGKHIEKESLVKGDLVFFENPSQTHIGHVGIYVGDNNFIHASTSKGVTVTSLADSYYNKRYVGARRILN